MKFTELLIYSINGIKAAIFINLSSIIFIMVYLK